MADTEEKKSSPEPEEESFELEVNPYMQTQEERDEDERQKSQVYMFSDEDRKKGTAKAAETNKLKGKITEYNALTAKEMREFSELLKRLLGTSQESLKLYLSSLVLNNRYRFFTAIFDVACGVCIASSETTEGKVRVYRRAPDKVLLKDIWDFLKEDPELAEKFVSGIKKESKKEKPAEDEPAVKGFDSKL